MSLDEAMERFREVVFNSLKLRRDSEPFRVFPQLRDIFASESVDDWLKRYPTTQDDKAHIHASSYGYHNPPRDAPSSIDYSVDRNEVTFAIDPSIVRDATSITYTNTERNTFKARTAYQVFGCQRLFVFGTHEDAERLVRDIMVLADRTMMSTVGIDLRRVQKMVTPFRNPDHLIHALRGHHRVRRAGVFYAHLPLADSDMRGCLQILHQYADDIVEMNWPH